MIEAAIKAELEELTALPVYPLILPATLLEGVSYQLVSDAEVETGPVRVNLIAARYQVRFSLLNDFTRLKTLDRKLWAKWREIRHGQIGDVPVQYVERGSIQESVYPQTNNQNLYTLTRDFIIYYREIS